MQVLFSDDRIVARCPGDPDLAQILSDPLIRAVMKADRVDPCALEADLRATASKLERARSPSVTAEPEGCIVCC